MLGVEIIPDESDSQIKSQSIKKIKVKKEIPAPGSPAQKKALSSKPEPAFHLQTPVSQSQVSSTQVEQPPQHNTSSASISLLKQLFLLSEADIREFIEKKTCQKKY